MQRDKKSKHISNGKIKYQDKLIFICHFIDARFLMSITLININRLKSCKNLALPKHLFTKFQKTEFTFISKSARDKVRDKLKSIFSRKQETRP